MWMTCSTRLPMVGVAFGGYGDNATAARRDFLNIGESLFVAQLGGGVGFVAGGEDNHGQGLVDEGVGTVLHFAGRVALGVNVGDFLELERAFEGDGEMDAAAEVEEVARGGETRRPAARTALSGSAAPLQSLRECG